MVVSWYNIHTKQVILELTELAKEINEAHKRGENTGLTEDDLAFMGKKRLTQTKIIDIFVVSNHLFAVRTHQHW